MIYVYGRPVSLPMRVAGITSSGTNVALFAGVGAMIFMLAKAMGVA
jgi:hypothetical protein